MSTTESTRPRRQPRATTFETEQATKFRSSSTKGVVDLSKYPRTGRRGAPQVFPRKLYEILSTEREDIIGWTDSGKSFIIKEMETFVTNILMKYFRHQKYSSFQRQLNLYGFRKVQKGTDVGSYAHECFIRDQPELLTKVRRIPQSAGAFPSQSQPPPSTTSKRSCPVSETARNVVSRLSDCFDKPVSGAGRHPAHTDDVTDYIEDAYVSGDKITAESELHELMAAAVTIGPELELDDMHVTVPVACVLVDPVIASECSEGSDSSDDNAPLHSSGEDNFIGNKIRLDDAGAHCVTTQPHSMALSFLNEISLLDESASSNGEVHAGFDNLAHLEPFDPEIAREEVHVPEAEIAWLQDLVLSQVEPAEPKRDSIDDVIEAVTTKPSDVDTLLERIDSLKVDIPATRRSRRHRTKGSATNKVYGEFMSSSDSSHPREGPGVVPSDFKWLASTSEDWSVSPERQQEADELERMTLVAGLTSPQSMRMAR